VSEGIGRTSRRHTRERRVKSKLAHSHPFTKPSLTNLIVSAVNINDREPCRKSKLNVPSRNFSSKPALHAKNSVIDITNVLVYINYVIYMIYKSHG